MRRGETEYTCTKRKGDARPPRWPLSLTLSLYSLNCRNFPARQLFICRHKWRCLFLVARIASRYKRRPGQPAPRYCPFQLTRRFCTLTFGRSLSPLCPALFFVVAHCFQGACCHCDTHRATRKLISAQVPKLHFLFNLFSLNLGGVFLGVKGRFF